MGNDAIPSILKPDFNLFRLNVGENRAFPNKLLAANGARFRALMIEPLKGFDLLRCVPDVLSVVQASS